MTSLRKLREGSNFVDLPGMQYFKPTFSGSSSTASIMSSIVAYFVATDTCYAKKPGAKLLSRSACSVIVTYPFDLFGGIYAVDSGALLAQAERKRRWTRSARTCPQR